MKISAIGTKPGRQEQQGFKRSKQFNAEKGAFENRRPELLSEMRKNFDWWGLFKKSLFKRGDEVPAQRIAEEKPDMGEFLKESNGVKSIWLGHSTFMLNLNGIVVLVDPVFSDHAAPVDLMVKRFQPPALSLEELPKVDYILISHDHYDHLDMKTIKFFRSKDTEFITPLGVGSRLLGWGIPRERITEKDWWESVEKAGLTFTATPAQHFSGRGLFDDGSTLWASWVIESGNFKLFFSGDSGYDTHFKEIGEKFGPFDAAYIESGQYNEMWQAVHMSPEESVRAFKDLTAKQYIPVHWGMFKLSTHSWNDPVTKLLNYSKLDNFDLLVPQLGQIINLNNPEPIDAWWEESLKEKTKKGFNFFNLFANCHLKAERSLAA